MKYYIVWLRNNTSRLDDEPVKIKAKSEEDAKRQVSRFLMNRFSIKRVYTLKEFKKWHPWWHKIFWGKKARNE